MCAFSFFILFFRWSCREHTFSFLHFCMWNVNLSFVLFFTFFRSFYCIFSIEIFSWILSAKILVPLWLSFIFNRFPFVTAVFISFGIENVFNAFQGIVLILFTKGYIVFQHEFIAFILSFLVENILQRTLRLHTCAM